MVKIRFIITVVELHTVLSYNEHIKCQQSFFILNNCSFSVLKTYIVTSYSYVEKSAIIFTLSHCGEGQFILIISYNI